MRQEPFLWRLFRPIANALVVGPLNELICRLERKVETLMASQEERLQAISKKIDAALKLLADLKANNPDIEDEITEIEGKLSGVSDEPPA